MKPRALLFFFAALGCNQILGIEEPTDRAGTGGMMGAAGTGGLGGSDAGGNGGTVDTAGTGGGPTGVAGSTAGAAGTSGAAGIGGGAASGGTSGTAGRGGVGGMAGTGGGAGSTGAAGRGGGGGGVVICTDPAQCNDGNPCSFDLCITNICMHPDLPNGNGCDDNIFCNGADQCMNGACVHAMNVCRTGFTCDEGKKICACNDGNVCTDDDRDQGNGTCAGTPVNARVVGACDSNTCMICCNGVLRDGRQRDYCAGCMPCSGSEQCVYSAGQACGWRWCCGN